jgi:hypothetical protein
MSRQYQLACRTIAPVLKGMALDSHPLMGLRFPCPDIVQPPGIGISAIADMDLAPSDRDRHAGAKE